MAIAILMIVQIKLHTYVRMYTIQCKLGTALGNYVYLHTHSLFSVNMLSILRPGPAYSLNNCICFAK